MIKTYDEALKTLNDIRTYLAIGKADDCVQELDKVAKYFINEKHKENPSFSECIKEWKDRGFHVKNNDKRIIFENKKINTIIYIDKLSKNIQICVFHYNYAQTISFDLHNLIHKTLKALDVEDENSRKN